MLLAIENISKAFGDNQVLNHVSFSLAYGQKIGLVGANGVGKSTLIKIIIGELESDGGAVQHRLGQQRAHSGCPVAAASRKRSIRAKGR